MAAGVFDRACVSAQLAAQGIPRTCAVLRRGLPARVGFDVIERRYRHTVAKKLGAAAGFDVLSALDARTFTAAALWALGAPRDAYTLGRTRAFFRTGRVAVLDELVAVDLATPEGARFASRLRTHLFPVSTFDVTLHPKDGRLRERFWSDVRDLASRCARRSQGIEPGTDLAR